MAQPCVASRAARRRERARRVAVRHAQRQSLELLQLLHGVGTQAEEDVQIVDIHAAHEKEEFVHGPKAVQQERIIQQSVEVPMAAKEIMHVPTIIPQECIIQQAVEQVVKAPIPMTQEEVVHEPTVKYDSIHGRYDGTIEADGDSLVIDGKKVALSHTRDPAEIPFTEHGDEYVCELEKEAPVEEIRAEVESRPEGDMKGFLDYCDEPLVSTDFETHTISSTFDSKAGISIDFERARNSLYELFEAGDISFEDFDRAWKYLNDEETYEADGD